MSSNKHNMEKRQSSCVFCQTRFARSDAARRHAKTCPKKNGRPVPQPLKRGRKFQACDFCASSKSACDGGRPCVGCSHRWRACTYDRVEQSCQSHPVSNPTLDITSQYHEEIAESSVRKLAMPWLLQYTDPHNDTIEQYFMCFSPSQQTRNYSLYPHYAHEGHVGTLFEGDLPPSFSASWNSDAFESLNPFLELDLLHTANLADCMDNKISQRLQSQQYSSQIDMRICEIVAALTETTRDECSVATGPPPLASVRFIFTADKVNHFVDMFFDNWNQHCPMIHRPSFDPAFAFPPLLAAIILMGAVYSSQYVAKAARDCINATEDYIFRHPEFERILSIGTGGAAVPFLPPLQAAFVVTILQHWDNHRVSRRRIRLHRYADLISAVRHLNLPKLKQRVDWSYEIVSHPEGWQAVVQIEEAIRLTLWVFLVDSSHTIFNRAPPKLTLAEMIGSLPCTEELFTLSAIEPQHKALWTQSCSKLPSLARGVALLMGNDWTDNSASEAGRLSYLDLFILISAIHEIIFHANAGCSFAIAKEAIQRALARWKLLWDVNTNGMATEREFTKGLGFYHHADEFWCLARLYLGEGMPLAQDSNKEVLDQDSMDSVNTFLKKFI